MGFFASGKEGGSAKDRSGLPSTALLHKMECRACPLNNAKCTTPKMPPSGIKEPLVYMLGEFPTDDDDDEGVQFAGSPGKLLRRQISKDWLGALRWNNVVRTRPPKGRLPETVEIECCRPSVIRDIETTKPDAIFGFGEIPLKWALEQYGVAKWRGRRIPIKVGSHACWFYPFWHPGYIARIRKGRGAEREDTFNMDLKKAFAEVAAGLPEPVVHSTSDAEADVSWVTGHLRGDVRLVKEFLEAAAEEDVSGVDIETTALRPYLNHSKMLTAAISTSFGTLAFPLYHPKAGWKGDDLREILAAFKAFLYAPKVRKVVHQLAFEMEWFAHFFNRDVLRRSLWGDSITQAAILDERIGDSKPGCLGLDFLTKQYFGLGIKSLSAVKRKDLINEPIEEVLRYNGVDAKYHRSLFLVQEARLKAEGLEAAYEMMVRRVPTVVLTQMKGLPVDDRMNQKFAVDLAKEVEDIGFQIQETNPAIAYKERFGHEYSPSSNNNTVALLSVIMKSEIGRQSLGGYSVDETVLEKLDHEIGKLIIEHRKISKLKSTYVDPLRLGGDHRYPDGLLHPILNTVYSETGRLSSEQPNEQNFPKRKHKEIRRQIRALANHQIVPFDYGQIEARVIAMASRDKAFVKALWERYDVHADWARRIAMAYPSRIGGKPFLNDKDVMKLLRDDVKNQLTFPAFFGAQSDAIASYLEIPPEVMRPLFDEFWKMFEGVAEWQERELKKYKKLGYVETLTGRRRNGPLSRNKIFNSPIQGTACDIVMDAMARLSEKEDWTLQPIMNVHDDLTFMLPDERLDEYAETIINEMLIVPYDFVNVPITIEMSLGPNWCDVKPVDSFSSDKR